MQKSEVTTREISLGMSTSERHAARILKSLHQQNVAKIVGKESLNQKGRPRLVYKIDLNGWPISFMKQERTIKSYL